MKIIAPLVCASTILISACAGFPQDEVNSQASATESSELSAHHYQCESGKTVAATYRATDSARVQYEGNIYSMQIAVSGSGARYVGDGLEWWTKGTGTGSEGTLFRHLNDGTSGDIIELCQEQ